MTLADAVVAPATGTADASKSVTPNAWIGTFTFPILDEAGNPILDEAGNPLLSEAYTTALGTANDATISVQPVAGVDAPGTAYNAIFAAAAYAYNTERAPATGTGVDAAAALGSNAETTTAIGAANDVTFAIAIPALAQVADATGTANDGATTGTTLAGIAAASGSADDASWFTIVAGYATPLVAEATGTAGANSSILPNAESTAAAGAANNATFATSKAALAEEAAAVGVGQDAQVTLSSPAAQVAAATGTAYDTSIAVSPSLHTAAASSICFDASITLWAAPQAAAATGSSNAPSLVVVITAGVAAGTGVAYDATVSYLRSWFFRWLVKPSNLRWTVGQIRLNGRVSMSWQPLDRDDDVPIAVIVRGDDYQGGIVDAAAATAEMAVILPDTHPAAGDWKSTTWKIDTTTTPRTYRALGPSPSDLALVPGQDYVVFVRLTDPGGVAIKRVSGLLSIV